MKVVTSQQIREIDRKAIEENNLSGLFDGKCWIKNISKS